MSPASSASPHLKEFEQAAPALAVADHGAERHGLRQRLERHGADTGPEAAPDLDDVHGLEGLERLAQGVPADTETLHQLRLGGERVAGAEPLLDDQLLDLLLGVGSDRSHAPSTLEP
ncbi:hypothetical protein GCM10010377_56340 [Streptomyces viridiviolaceus]|nr:hypothetical protein GCM10010377_56340 [Streptomyces viridiviolaceus]